VTSPVPAEPRVSAVVVSHNTREDLLRCLAALRSTVRVPIETIVVDNDSHDGSAAAVARDFPDARVVANRDNLGFARANNLGARLARGAYLLVLNSDAEIREGCVEALCRVLGIELTEDRRRELARLDAAGLEAWLAQLQERRSWT